MNQVTMQALNQGPEFQVALGRVVRSDQGNGLEICRERSTLTDLLRMADQKIFVRTVKPAKSTDDISGVGAHPKFRDPPNIDCNFHGTTTESLPQVDAVLNGKSSPALPCGQSMEA